MKTKKYLEEKVNDYIERHHMLQAGDKVIVGVSGGADSVCLLFLLLAFAKKVPLSLAVVHVNHKIRTEAVEDAKYVEQLCKEQDLPFYLVNADVRKEAKLRKLSEEEAGRNIRYQAFAEAAKDFGATKIAVAHNSNDRVETMLFHLFRGSGIKGLIGIMPVREQIIRPILCLKRQEIEDYLNQQSIFYCNDVTNEKDDYTRNRIRHHIIPYVEEEISAGCISHMMQTADLLLETENYLSLQTREALEACVLQEHKKDTVKMSVAFFKTFHPAIQKRMIYQVLMTLSPAKKDISAVHVMDVLDLFLEEGNRHLDLPFGMAADRVYGDVIVQIKERSAQAYKMEWIMQTLTGTCEEMLGCSAEEFIKKPVRKSKEVTVNECTKWFDYDKIKQLPVLRTRKSGDYLTIADGKGGYLHKSVKDYMITEKIPKEERDKIPLVAIDNHVLWLVGYRISEYFKMQANTKRVFQVQLLKRDCEDAQTEEKNDRTY